MKTNPFMDINGDGKFDTIDMILYETAHNMVFGQEDSNDYSLLNEYEDDPEDDYDEMDDLLDESDVDDFDSDDIDWNDTSDSDSFDWDSDFD